MHFVFLHSVAVTESCPKIILLDLGGGISNFKVKLQIWDG